MSLKEQIVNILRESDGLTDREIINLIRGTASNQQPINQACRQLETENRLRRMKRYEDGLIGNYLCSDSLPQSLVKSEPGVIHPANEKGNRITNLSEDELKTYLDSFLKKNGWSTNIAWGRNHGIDIDAYRGNERWIIEVKGAGSLNPMRVNYFIAILGEILQKMSDPNAKYSIALPHLNQFLKLWDRLPELAKNRTGISALFVDEDGIIIEKR